MSEMKSALLLIDLQNDFCPGGSLAIEKADEIIPLANQLQSYFDTIIATKDWHPKDHMSFASNHRGKKIGDRMMLNEIEQILWPNHCVQGSYGAEFHPDLNTRKITKSFLKGIDKTIDSYSAFFDNAHLRSTGLTEYLRENNISTLYVMGLATDYCVKFSCLDAAHLGFNVYVIQDACRGVELNKGDIALAFKEMSEANVKIIQSKEFKI